MFEDPVAMMEATYGPGHPQVACSRPIGASRLLALGDFPLARTTAECALKINETALRPHHAVVATTLLYLVRVMMERNGLVALQSLLERHRGRHLVQLGSRVTRPSGDRCGPSHEQTPLVHHRGGPRFQPS